MGRRSRPGAGGRGLVSPLQARTNTLDLLRPLENAVKAAKWRVWRDEPSLRPGDLFADKIDAALLSCAGAVGLLDPDALDPSPWVRWECTILTWRQRIQVPVRVVRVLIDVDIEQLDAAGYGPSRLDKALAYTFDPGGAARGTPAYAAMLRAHARRIVEALGMLEAEPTGALSVWVNRVADCRPLRWESWRATVQKQLRNGERLQLQRTRSGSSDASCWSPSATDSNASQTHSTAFRSLIVRR